MASIVYITDRQMLEYHRINGNRTMNFWRPGSMRTIADFEPGDFLFFMTKGTERGRSKEKGLVGYGKFVKSETTGIKQMWKKYKEENGYTNELDFTEAVIKVTKNKKMPERISSLYLEGCTYFQSPIYLSEIGIKVSNSIESYIYPDKYDPNATQKILKTAREIGEDPWIAMINNEDYVLTNFLDDEIRYVISNTVNHYDRIYYDKERKKAQKISRLLQKQVIRQNPIEAVKSSTIYSISLQTGRVELFVPFVSLNKQKTSRIQTLIGHCSILKESLKQKLPQMNVEVTIVFKEMMEEEIENLLRMTKISYLFLED